MKIDSKINNLLHKRYNPEGSVLRRAQCRMVEMLEWFDNICTNNNLMYWMDAGTLLGAVRHDGFIPWDDDVDVCMMREDAEKLHRILLDNTEKSQFILQDHDNDPWYFMFWDKIRDLKSKNNASSFIQDRLFFKGLAIDIFPVDEGNIQCFSNSITWMFEHFVLYPFYENNGIWNHLSFMARPSRFLIKKILIPFAHLLSRHRSNEILSYSYGVPFKDIHTKDVVFPLRRIPFEGLLLLAPNNPEQYLVQKFGDSWSDLPSASQRGGHSIELEIYD